MAGLLCPNLAIQCDKAATQTTAGDEVLRQTDCESLCERRADSDLVARNGGDS